MQISTSKTSASRFKLGTSPRRPASFRPIVENLEDRLVPATFVDAAGILQVSGSFANESILIVDLGTVIRVTKASMFGHFPAFIPESNVTGIRVMGFGGNDTIRNFTSLPMEAHGGDGYDVIIGGNAADVLFGDGGNDKLFGAGGNDILKGGNGNDQLFGDAGDDMLFGDAGDDLLFGLAGNDKLYGGAGLDTLQGREGDDSLYGTSATLKDGLRDKLHGGPGNDGFRAEGLGRNNLDYPKDFAAGDFFFPLSRS